MMAVRTIYLSGPISGMPEKNHPLFMRVAGELRSQGHKVYNPREFCWTDNVFPKRRAFAEYCSFICNEADTIVLLPGWENSKGATTERGLAENCGLEIVEWMPAPIFFDDVGGPPMTNPKAGQPDMVERLRQAYAKVAEWPERRMTEGAVAELGVGFNDLLELRNLVPEAAALIVSLQSQLEAVTARLEHYIGMHGVNIRTGRKLIMRERARAETAERERDAMREALEDIERGYDGFQSYSGTNCADIARKALQPQGDK